MQPSASRPYFERILIAQRWDRCCFEQKRREHNKRIAEQLCSSLPPASECAQPTPATQSVQAAPEPATK